MSVVQTVLIFVVVPAALYGLMALLTLRERAAKNPRYRPGQEWDYPPVWWTANPDGVGEARAAAATAVATVATEGDDTVSAQPARTACGGARGSW